jgi:tRNA-dihydrouridine synthase 3
VLNDQPPFVRSPDNQSATESGTSIDFSTVCPVFKEMGECSQGFKCRFLGGHVRRDDAGVFHLIQDEDKKAHSAVSMAELNFTTPETIKLLRSRKVSMRFTVRRPSNKLSWQYPHPKSDTFMKKLAVMNEDRDIDAYPLLPPEEQGSECTTSITCAEPEQNLEATNALIEKRTAQSPFQTDTSEVPLRFSEKKRLHWAGKTCKHLTQEVLRALTVLRFGAANDCR